SVEVKGLGTFSKKVHKGRGLVTPLVNEGKPIQYEDSHYMKFHLSLSCRQSLKLASMRFEKELAPETGCPPSEERPKKNAKEKSGPSKAEAAPKRAPGRSPKAKVEAKEEKQKKRGRPSKAEIAAREAAAKAADKKAEEPSEEDEEETPKPRKRGRPSKA